MFDRECVAAEYTADALDSSFTERERKKNRREDEGRSKEEEGMERVEQKERF